MSQVLGKLLANHQAWGWFCRTSKQVSAPKQYAICVDIFQLKIIDGPVNSPCLNRSLYRVPFTSPQVTGSSDCLKLIFSSLGILGPARKHFFFPFHLLLQLCIVPPHLSWELSFIIQNVLEVFPPWISYISKSFFHGTLDSCRYCCPPFHPLKYATTAWHVVGSQLSSWLVISTYHTMIFLLMFWREISTHIIALTLS